MTTFSLREIWRYPVKSMAGERLETATLGGGGLPGDRAWAVQDRERGRLCTGKNLPALMQCAARLLRDAGKGAPLVDITLPDGASVRSDDGAIDARLSEALGRAVTLLPPRPAAPSADPDAGGYFDLAAVHLLTDSSLRLLQGKLPEIPIDRRRCRPNLLLADDGGAAGMVEFDWVGRRLTLGGAELEVEAPTGRCAMVTRAQDDLPAAGEILRTLFEDAGGNMGVYARVARAGDLALGDRLTV